MTVLDLVATTKELRKALIGTRLANIYDINAKTFLFKFARSDEKLFLLMESGIRVHLTKYSREKGDMPNGFNMKLRKHIRTKLVHDFQQMAGDRVIFITFGTGENAFHVILELYAAGNVILADHEFTILSLLRPYELETDGVRVAVGERYPVQLGGMQFPPIDAPTLAAWWTKALENPKNKVVADIFPPGSPFSPMVIDHCLVRAAFDPKTPLRSVWDGAGAIARCDEMVAALAPATVLLQSISTQLPMKGVLVVQPPAKDKIKSATAAAAAAAAASSADAGASASATETDVNYSEFVPFLFANFERQQTREFDSFNEAIDEFFTRVESSKESSRIAAQVSFRFFLSVRVSWCLRACRSIHSRRCAIHTYYRRLPRGARSSASRRITSSALPSSSSSRRPSSSRRV